ncbi:hypothetical protein AHAS_Ahas09G0205600 [Arachis hypogaea]
MKVFAGRGLVSMVVEGHIKEGVHRYIVVGVDCHEEVHHNHCLGMHHKMVVAHSTLEGVVSKRVDQILVAPPIFDCPILDASLHCNLHLTFYNIIVTKLIAKGVRIHGNKRE